MEKRIKRDVNTYLQELRSLEEIQRSRLLELKHADDKILVRRASSCGNWHYCVRGRGEKRYCYLGNDDKKEVQNIKEYRYLSKAHKRVAHNISITEDYLRRLKNCDYDSVNAMLPDTYRNGIISNSVSSDDRRQKWKNDAEAIKEKIGPFRVAELKIKTNDGNLVRSKSEAMIYNYLMSMGVSFVYELPLRMGNRTVFPDFTLLSEVDLKTEIIIEHQGMMGDSFYREKFSEKLYEYLRNGYVQGVNIFYTFDDLNGGFDILPIKHIVNNHIKSNDYNE